MVLFSGSYLACLCVMACSGNLSWQYVNSMNWIVWLGEGDIGGCFCFGAPITHRMSGLSLAWHWHGFGWKMHWSSHPGIGIVIMLLCVGDSCSRQVTKSIKDEGGDYNYEVLSNGCKWVKRIQL
jgi:hypothetical protein